MSGADGRRETARSLPSLVGDTTSRSREPYTDEERRNIDTVLALRRATLPGRARYLTPDYRVHRRGMAHMAAALHGADDAGGYSAESIADRSDRIEDIIARGDRVWAVWTIRGTHTGRLFGIDATGARIEILEMGIWRLVDGKIAEAWFFADEFALSTALGLGGPGRVR